MHKLSVYSYDVWGNAKDGYQVNDLIHFGTFEIPFWEIELDVDKSLLKFLKLIHFLKNSVRVNSLVFEGDPDYVIYVNRAKDGYPICEIRNDRK